MSVYRARMDGFVLTMTTCILVLFGVIMVAILMATSSRPGGIMVNAALVAATFFVAGIAICAYVYTPKAFHLEDGVLRVERFAGDVSIPLAAVHDVQPFDTFLGLSLKTPPGGNSGLFGIYGTFYRRDLGKFQLYSRRANHTVLLTTADATIIVAPDRREEFIAAIRREIAS